MTDDIKKEPTVLSVSSNDTTDIVQLLSVTVLLAVGCRISFKWTNL